MQVRVAVAVGRRRAHDQNLLAGAVQVLRREQEPQEACEDQEQLDRHHQLVLLAVHGSECFRLAEDQVSGGTEGNHDESEDGVRDANNLHEVIGMRHFGLEQQDLVVAVKEAHG